MFMGDTSYVVRRYGIKAVWLLLAVSAPLFSGDVDVLLASYTDENKLSQRTIDANKGHLILYTRNKLEKMHAKTLKDVFKTTPAIYYHENRYALPDPLSSGNLEPYRSNFIRLFVDGVEITHGWAGSGLLLYGDINIDFVDHIEFYYMTPSFETSVEPAFLTIYLYSKDLERDGGAKINLAGGTHGYNMQTFSYGDTKDNLSYMINLSHTDAKRDKIDNGTDIPLSRDFSRWQLFSYVKTDSQIFHLQVIKKDTDALAGGSWDATPLKSNIDFLNLHMDYGIDLTPEWHGMFSYDRLRMDVDFRDDFPLMWTIPPRSELQMRTQNSTMTGELTYIKPIGDHRLNAGIKGRIKDFDSVRLFGVSIPTPDFDHEGVVSIFLQDQYTLSPGKLLSASIAYNRFFRNGSVKDDSLLQMRLGYIYSGEVWSYKTYLYRTQVAIEPLMRYFYPSVTQNLAPQTTLGMTHEIAYTRDKQHLRFIFNIMKDNNSLLQHTIGGQDDTRYLTTILNYDYDFDQDNRMNVQLYYSGYKHIFDLDELHDFSGYFSLFNTYGDIDLYNGVVWHRNSLDWKNYFDWTSTLTWNISEEMSLTLKGDNILGKAKETNLYRFDVGSGMPVPLPPLSISPIDRRFTVELEYRF